MGLFNLITSTHKKTPNASRAKIIFRRLGEIRLVTNPTIIVTLIANPAPSMVSYGINQFPPVIFDNYNNYTRTRENVKPLNAKHAFFKNHLLYLKNKN